jgi:hypothetical protein
MTKIDTQLLLIAPQKGECKRGVFRKDTPYALKRKG